MEHSTAGNGETIKSMDLVLMIGQMVADMRVNGGETNCTTEVYTLGQMVVSMTANMLMIKSTVGAFTSGLMEKGTRDIGIMGNNMVKENSLIQQARVELVFGLMVKE
jgi:hypothetical protein